MNVCVRTRRKTFWVQCVAERTSRTFTASAPARHMQNGRLIAVIVAQRKYSPARIRNLSYRFGVKCGSRHMLLFGMLAKQTANETKKKKSHHHEVNDRVWRERDRVPRPSFQLRKHIGKGLRRER